MEIKTIIDYINTIIAKMIKNCGNDGENYDISGVNLYEISAPQVSFSSIIGFMDKDNRKKLFEKGIDMIENRTRYIM